MREDMTGREWRRRSMEELEEKMKDSLNGHSYSREDHFRRNGLPILSGLLDGTFNEHAWINLVSSPHVAYDIYSNDGSELLFTLPPLMYVGSSLIGSDDQPSLTEETSQLIKQAGGANLLSDEAVGQLVVTTVSAIGEATYPAAVLRAKHTIDTINAIFTRYGIAGQVQYPDGLEAAVAEASGVSADAPAKTETKTATAQQQPTYSFDDGEDL